MMTSEQSQEFLERYKHLEAIELEKNQLIEDLLRRLSEVEGAYQREKLDRERETRFNRDIQIHEMELMEQISQVKNIMDREPFIIVLLNGDSIIFNETYLQQGEIGGRKAAQQLWDTLQDYIIENFSGTLQPKIMVRLYTNVKLLKELCEKAGIVDDPAQIDSFIEGFNTSKALFDIVNTGSDRDQADKKITEIFRLHLYNCHCHQILIGCSQGPECAQVLHEIQMTRELAGRISLIEGTPFEQDLEAIRSAYRVMRFQDLFRDSKITPAAGPWKAPVAQAPQPIPTPSPSVGLSVLTRTPTNTTTASSNTSAPAVSAIVAANAPKPKPTNEQTVLSKPTTATEIEVQQLKTIPRNRYGQRIDKFEFKNIPRDEINRIKKMKLCNSHFLLGGCSSDNCYHNHKYKLSKKEAHILQAIAHMTPCRFGSECDDLDCIYGHRCPYGQPGKKDCFYGSNCRFTAAQHGIDTNVVKLTKV
ncbi:hypothetical protein ASPZODRAFT_127223 [Penicilliopsis zonata CBS 506.65]|uniref:C3H1-type domain-containing protein n=1 Tax=Penicilliopsis zonata CBS 506.65 TaxID=1073090 RepID=A0A1L9SVI3_9EURO|nr:hypothetical protein ASPZODRAFT_127223 [Penicilliopsis zonata CBS 506.65]OJJ51198.1 hypothetical protein ASPZODRAFT_127223 [Penicilliopsis zonata CBS 506.65]